MTYTQRDTTETLVALRALRAKWYERASHNGYGIYVKVGLAQMQCVEELDAVISALVSRSAQGETPPQHIIDFAVQAAGCSPCRSKRGVVIFRGEDVVTHGYNYKPRGFDCDGSQACKATCRVEAVHAEQQALLMAGTKASGADMLHVKVTDGVLVQSGGPSCVQCSKLAKAAGVAGFWLYHEHGWRRYEMAEFHRLSLSAASANAQGETPPQEPEEPACTSCDDTGVRASGGRREGDR